MDDEDYDYYDEQQQYVNEVNVYDRVQSDAVNLRFNGNTLKLKDLYRSLFYHRNISDADKFLLVLEAVIDFFRNDLRLTNDDIGKIQYGVKLRDNYQYYNALGVVLGYYARKNVDMQKAIEHIPPDNGIEPQDLYRYAALFD